MPDNLFGGLSGLGGLMRGLSGMMPQDDPNLKLMNLQGKLSDLEQEEMELYAAIGREVLADQSAGFLQQKEELARNREKQVSVKQEIAALQSEKEKTEKAQKLEEEKLTCPNCGFRNEEGVKFCRECGTKLGGNICPACGAVLAPGTRFCGSCGAAQKQ